MRTWLIFGTALRRPCAVTSSEAERCQLSDTGIWLSRRGNERILLAKFCSMTTGIVKLRRCDEARLTRSRVST